MKTVELEWMTKDHKFIPLSKMTDSHLMAVLNGGFAIGDDYNEMIKEAKKRKLDTTYAQEGFDDPYLDEEMVTGRHPFGN